MSVNCATNNTNRAVIQQQQIIEKPADSSTTHSNQPVNKTQSAERLEQDPAKQAAARAEQQKQIDPNTAQKYFKMQANSPLQSAQQVPQGQQNVSTAGAVTNQAKQEGPSQETGGPVRALPIEEPNVDPVYLKDGQIYVRGGEGDDTIGLSRGKETGYTVNFNGKDYNFGDDVTGFNVHSGAGDDKISIEEGLFNVKVHGGAGDDTIENKSNFAKIHGGEGDDKINNAAHGANIQGGLGNDIVNSKGHLNTIRTHAGNDTVNIQGNLNAVRGGRGRDTVNATGNLNALSGNRGHDTISSTGNGNVIRGGRGRDSIGSGGFANHIRGGRGADTIAVYGYGNNVNGNRGADQIAALGWGNHVRGGRGADQVWVNGLNRPEALTPPNFGGMPTHPIGRPPAANDPFGGAQKINPTGQPISGTFDPNNVFNNLLQNLQPQQQLQLLGFLFQLLSQSPQFGQTPNAAFA
ncbi:MAG: hypothetical protein VYC39_03425 [Myxococcota bacterium]|nr:hypothetical protein [Myxococcota bacterium]